MDLPKHPVVHGHPIHAILSDGPVVLIPLAIAAELWDRNGPAEGIRFGDLVTTGAAVTTLAAGLVGWIDWLTVPSGHPVRRPATIHGIINTTALVALAGAIPAGHQRLKFLAAAEVAILVGAWIGGDLVFRHGGETLDDTPRRPKGGTRIHFACRRPSRARRAGANPN